MSSILDNKQNRIKCQKFTPRNIVENMLNMAGYSKNLSGKRILEPSFGSGNILALIVERYIQDSLARQIAPDAISQNISRDIYGIELDEKLYAECLYKLNAMISEYNLPTVDWSLFHGDALKRNFDVLFDFIVGNPPYINYQDMDEENRAYIKASFSSCSTGKFDYCYAFIEKSIGLLSDAGKLVQLVPENIYKTVFGGKLRAMLRPHLVTVWEYPNQKMFGDAMTSSSLFLFDKACATETVEYQNVTEKTHVQIPRENLHGKWIFQQSSLPDESALRFGDLFHAFSAPATLCNKAYVIPGDSPEKNRIEADVLRPAASPRACSLGKEEYIIFPYAYSDGTLQHYSAGEFRKKFPKATRHLNRFREQLKKRKSDRSAKWFEYGRSQALTRLNQKKLLFSTVITKKVELYELSAETAPYSGIVITVKNPQYTLEDAKKILESARFLEYISAVGISVSGKSKRISCKDVSDYKFPKEERHGETSICN